MSSGSVQQTPVGPLTEPASTAIDRGRRRRRVGVKHGIAFTGPFIALYAIFVLYPVIQAVRMSLYDWDLLGYTREFIGLDNYVRMLWGTEMTWSMAHLFWPRVLTLAAAVALLAKPLRTRTISRTRVLGVVGLLALAVALGFHPGDGGFWNDATFWVSLKNTIVFTAISTPLIAGLGLVMALALQGRRRGSKFYQTAFFLPYILPVSVATLIWSYFLSPDRGLLAKLLGYVGVEPIAWLSDPQFAMAGIILTTVWWTVGFNLILFAAGLQDIDPTLYEAAALDGAGPLRKFWFITLPGLNHVVVLVVITQVIASFQVFGQVNIMTSGGPGGATRVLIQHIYQAGFRDFELGYASAVSMFLFVLMLIVAALQFKVVGREK